MASKAKILCALADATSRRALAHKSPPAGRKGTRAANNGIKSNRRTKKKEENPRRAEWKSMIGLTFGAVSDGRHLLPSPQPIFILFNELHAFTSDQFAIICQLSRIDDKNRLDDLSIVQSSKFLRIATRWLWPFKKKPPMYLKDFKVNQRNDLWIVSRMNFLKKLSS